MDNEHTKINMFPFIITSLSVLGIITISSILAFFDMVMTTDGSIVAYDGTQSVQCLM